MEQEGRGRILKEKELEDRGHRTRWSHKEKEIEEGEAQEQQLMLSWPAINRAQEAGAVRLPLAKEKAPPRKAENKEAEQQLLTMIPETMRMQQARKDLEIQKLWREEKGNRK